MAQSAFVPYQGRWHTSFVLSALNQRVATAGLHLTGTRDDCEGPRHAITSIRGSLVFHEPISCGHAMLGHRLQLQSSEGGAGRLNYLLGLGLLYHITGLDWHWQISST